MDKRKRKKYNSTALDEEALNLLTTAKMCVRSLRL